MPKNRRSTRQFTEEKLTAEKVEQIMKAALMAPTSKNGRYKARHPSKMLSLPLLISDCKRKTWVWAVVGAKLPAGKPHDEDNLLWEKVHVGKF